MPSPAFACGWSPTMAEYQLHARGKEREKEKKKGKKERGRKSEETKILTSRAHLDTWRAVNGVSYHLCVKIDLPNVFLSSFHPCESHGISICISLSTLVVTEYF